MGTLLPREKHKAAYDKALVQRYQHMPDIRRIARHRHVPAAIYKVRAARSLTSDPGTGPQGGTADSRQPLTGLRRSPT